MIREPRLCPTCDRMRSSRFVAGECESCYKMRRYRTDERFRRQAIDAVLRRKSSSPTKQCKGCCQEKPLHCRGFCKVCYDKFRYHDLLNTNRERRPYTKKRKPHKRRHARRVANPWIGKSVKVELGGEVRVNATILSGPERVDDEPTFTVKTATGVLQVLARDLVVML